MDADIEYCKINKPYLYRMVDEGNIKNLPGYDIEYDIPANPDIILTPGIEQEKTDKVLDCINEFFPLD